MIFYRVSVRVAAGRSPILIGSKANGSIQSAASRSNLYALKITPQTLSTEGVFHIVPTVESLGEIAKTVADLEEVTKFILQTVKKPMERDIDRSKEGLQLPRVKIPQHEHFIQKNSV